MEQSYFQILNSINLNDKKQTKGNLTYLSWAYAWGELKNHFPDATYKVYERDQVIETTEESHYEAVKQDIEKGIPGSPAGVVTIKKTTTVPVNYFTDGRTCWVKVGVTVEGIEHIEELPVMDNRNKSISSAAVTSTDVNKAIQRALTKAIARHGLGLYIYSNEDLPEDSKQDMTQQIQEQEHFENLKQDVIDLIQSFFGTDKEKEVDKYIKDNFNVRISQTTSEHEDILAAAKTFLMELRNRA